MPAPQLKPNFFDGMTDVKLSLSNYCKKLHTAIDKRDDLDWPIKDYLHLLASSANKERVTPTELQKAYNKIKNDTQLVNAIQKDYGEMLAPIICLRQTNKQNKDLGLGELSIANSRIFLPEAGNFPLVDFLIYHGPTGEDKYQFSVKIKGATTNVIKPQDIIETLKANKNTKLMKKHEYKVLQILQENNAQHGPIAALVYLDSKAKSMGVTTNIGGSKSADLRARYAVNASGAITGQKLSQADMEKAGTAWKKTLEPFMKKYYPQMLDVWNTSKWQGKRIDMPYEKALSITCQYALGKISKNEGKLKYKQFLDAEKSSVSYFKFALDGQGNFSYNIENDTNLTDTKEYYLRAKNTPRDSGAGKTRAYADKIGVQP